MSTQQEFTFDSEKEETLVTIPVGIHTNVKVTKIEQGDTYIDIFFEDTLKRSTNLRVYEPSGSYPNKEETTEEAEKRDAMEKASIFSKLCKIFDVPRVTSTDYFDYVEKCVKALTPRLSKATVNLKLIYDKDFKYSRFPKYNFVEKFEEGVPVGLAYSDWEMANRVNKVVPKSSHDLL